MERERLKQRVSEDLSQDYRKEAARNKTTAEKALGFVAALGIACTAVGLIGAGCAAAGAMWPAAGAMLFGVAAVGVGTAVSTLAAKELIVFRRMNDLLAADTASGAYDARFDKKLMQKMKEAERQEKFRQRKSAVDDGKAAPLSENGAATGAFSRAADREEAPPAPMYVVPKPPGIQPASGLAA